MIPILHAIICIAGIALGVLLVAAPWEGYIIYLAIGLSIVSAISLAFFGIFSSREIALDRIKKNETIFIILIIFSAGSLAGIEAHIRAIVFIAAGSVGLWQLWRRKLR